MAGVRIPTLDVPRIVGVFGGGPVECAAACQSVGFSVSISTIRRWIYRDRIPMDGWLMVARTYGLLRAPGILDLSTFWRMAT